MINAKLNIIPIFFDHTEIKSKIVATKDFQFPYINVESNLDIINALNHVLDLYIDSNIPLNNFKLTDVTITENKLDIYYIVFINYETNFKVTSQLLDTDTDQLKIPNNAKKIIELL